MSYVDPNFDTYSLDACARYGILSCDPCMYLKGTPSPYLTQYYTPQQAIAPIPQDKYTPTSTNNEIIKGVMPWKKKALALLGLVVAATVAIRHPNTVKKIIPQKVRTFAVDHTPKWVKKSWKYCHDKVKSWFK